MNKTIVFKINFHTDYDFGIDGIVCDVFWTLHPNGIDTNIILYNIYFNIMVSLDCVLIISSLACVSVPTGQMSICLVRTISFGYLR